MIYFAQAGPHRLVKIGTSDNLPSRLCSLRYSLHHPVVVLGVMHGGIQEEKTLHRQFRRLSTKRDGVKGEWFFPESELLAYIQNRAISWKPADRPWEAPISLEFTGRLRPPVGFSNPEKR